jgi:hypothetical protein
MVPTIKPVGLDEELIKLLAMDLDLVTRYGPTDASLLEIARQNIATRPLVLTLDNHLYGECWHQEIESELLRDACNRSGLTTLG